MTGTIEELGVPAAPAPVVPGAPPAPTGEHVCAVPVSDEQLWEMSAAYLAAGLAAAEQVTYFDDGTADAVLDRMVDDRTPVTEPLRTGQLEIVPSEVTRAALRNPPDAVRELLGERIDAAVRAGWTGFRMTGQLSSALDEDGRVAAYDAAVQGVLRGRPAKAMCFYDRRRFPEDAIDALRAAHEREVVVPAVYDDNLLRITTTGPATVRLAGEVDHSNRPRIRKLLTATLDQALRSATAPMEITLDLSSLRFVDVAGAVSLVHAAEEFPSTHRLVLTGVRPRVLRVLDRCGAPFAAQLRVEPRLPEEPGPR